MKVNYLWTRKEITVTLNEVEAQRITAFIFDQLSISADPDADISAKLEDALNEILS